MKEVTGGQELPYAFTTYSGLVRSTVYYLAEQLTWQQLPLELQAPSAIEALAAGERDVTLALLEFLYHICHPEADSCCAGSVSSACNPNSSAGKVAKHQRGLPTSVPVAAPASIPPPQPSTEPVTRHRTSVSARHSSASKVLTRPISVSQPTSRPVSASRSGSSQRALPRRRHSHNAADKSLSRSVSAVTSSASFARHSACITGKHLTSSVSAVDVAAQHYDIFAESSTLTLDEKHHLLDWIISLDIKLNPAMLTTELFSNKWRNGVLLSEVAAAVCREHKDLVKQVQEKTTTKVYESSKPMLILASTEHNVHSRAQIARNINTAVHVLTTRRSISSLPSVEELIDGSVSLWEVLLAIFRSVRSRATTPKRRTMSSSCTPTSRSRSRSPVQSRRSTTDKVTGARKRSHSAGAAIQRSADNPTSASTSSPATNGAEKPLDKPKPATSPKSILKRPVTSPSSTADLPEWNDSTIIATPKRRPVASAVLRAQHEAKHILRKSLENAKKRPAEWKLSHPAGPSPEQPMLHTVTGAQQIAVRDWLRTLGIYIRDGEGGFKHPSLPATVAASVSMIELHEDRIRNGVLMCLILLAVEVNACIHTQLGKYMYLRPTTLAQALSNIERALWIFRLRKCPPIPLVYLSHAKRILECDKDYVWGLLYEIMQAYDTSINSTPTITSQPASLSSVNIPYTPKQRQELDKSLMQWMASLEVLPGLYNAVDDMPSVLTLETALRNGTLLCAVAMKICGKENSKSIRGWNKAPKTFPQYVMNLRKCTAALNRCLTMSQRYLYSGVEEDIARGEWTAILGLLQDIHRYHDRELPPGTTGGYPYLGKPSHWPFDCEEQEKQIPRLHTSVSGDIVPKQPSSSAVVDDENIHVNVMSPQPLPSAMRSVVATGKTDILPGIMSTFVVEVTISDPHRLAGGQIQRYSHDLTPMVRGSPPQDAYRGAPKPLSLRVQAATSRATAAENDVDMPPPPPPSPPPATPTIPRRQRQQYDDVVSVASTPPPAPLIRTKITTLLHQHHAKDACSAFKWLTSLNLPFALPREVKEAGKHDTLPAFADGVIFCKLLQFLERGSTIPGVVLTPKTRAHKLQNIRKVLDMLTRHKHVPLSVLAYEDDILEGRAQAIVDVLLKIKEVYKFRRNWRVVR